MQIDLALLTIEQVKAIGFDLLMQQQETASNLQMVQVALNQKMRELAAKAAEEKAA